MRVLTWTAFASITLAGAAVSADPVKFEPAAISIDIPQGWSRSIQDGTLTLMDSSQQGAVSFTIVPAGSAQNGIALAGGALAKSFRNVIFQQQKTTTVGGMNGISSQGHGWSQGVGYTLLLLALDTPAYNDLLVIAMDTDQKLASHQSALNYILNHLQPYGTRMQVAAQPVASTQAASTQDQVQVSQRALPPRNLTIDDLGRPCDDNFQLLSGPDAGRLYEPASRVHASSSVEVQSTMVSDTRTFQANASFLGLFGVGGSNTNDRRYWDYRASETAEVASVNDQTELSHAPPARARWYVAEIDLGHSYDVIFQGNRTEFTAGILGALRTFSGGVKTSREANKVSWSFHGLGIQPVANADLIISPNPGDVMRVYQRTSESVPVWVVYKSIPGQTPSPQAPIEWDNVQIEQSALSCGCVEGQSIELVCRAHNYGSRVLDVSVVANGTTGTWGYSASGTGRDRVAAHGVKDISVRAPISGAMFNCSNATDCTCDLGAVYAP